jgi:galactose oxidase
VCCSGMISPCLSNGALLAQVFVLADSWNGGRGGKSAEVFNGSDWRLLPNVVTGPMQTADFGGIFRSDNHGCASRAGACWQQPEC